MLELCTYFDRNYLLQGLALYRSLERHSSDFRLTILTLDQDTDAVLKRLHLPCARLLPLEELVRQDSGLRRIRPSRPPIEFYYACTPALLAQVLAEASRGPASYVDADMYYFADPQRVHDRYPDAEVLIVEHRSGELDLEREHGRFNVCLVSIGSTENARDCLHWWQEVTLESTRLGDGVWGDQKYLDEFESRFSGVETVSEPETASAPWNIWRHTITQDANGHVVIDGAQMIVFHFARLLAISANLFIPVRRDYLPRTAIKHIYRPYFRALRAALEEIRGEWPQYRPSFSRRNLRGALLSLPTGRLFFEGDIGLIRLGPYVPSGSIEMRQRRAHRQLSELVSHTPWRP